jgi:serine/threonine protein kinase
VGEGRRYRIEGVLGKGGFGTVYKAQLLGEGGFTRQVALKVLNADMAGMEDVARRLRDEARLLGLLRHRAILHVDGLVRMKGRWTVVMEYIEGSDLQRVARAGGVPLGPALEIVGEVASALHVAYTTPSPSGVPLKLLHRDIKPPNILMTAAGEVKVLDFGIARAEFGNREAMTRSVLYGSVGYMAPERLDFEELPEGDVYALGTVLYEILVGSPFGKASIRTERHQAKIDEGLDLIRRKLGALPPDFPELLGAMLAYDPEDRPSAREVERRCRSIRQQVQGPWLRDWAEKAVPPLLVNRDELPSDDFTGSIVAESGGVALLAEDDEPAGSEDGVALTMPLEGGAGAGGTASASRRSGGGGLRAVLAGMGVAGCLGIAGLGAVLVVVAGLVAVSFVGPSTSTATPQGGSVGQGSPAPGPSSTGSPSTGSPPSATGSPAPASSAGAGAAPVAGLEDYGPPQGPSLRASLTAPWADKDLPIAPGNVAFSDATRLVIMYSGPDSEGLARVWKASLIREFGLEPEFDYAADGMVSTTFVRGQRRVALAVAPSMDNLAVSIAFTQ